MTPEQARTISDKANAELQKLYDKELEDCIAQAYKTIEFCAKDGLYYASLIAPKNRLAPFIKHFQSIGYDVTNSQVDFIVVSWLRKGNHEA